MQRRPRATTHAAQRNPQLRGNCTATTNTKYIRTHNKKHTPAGELVHRVLVGERAHERHEVPRRGAFEQRLEQAAADGVRRDAQLLALQLLEHVVQQQLALLVVLYRLDVLSDLCEVLHGLRLHPRLSRLPRHVAIRLPGPLPLLRLGARGFLDVLCIAHF